MVPAEAEQRARAKPCVGNTDLQNISQIIRSPKHFGSTAHRANNTEIQNNNPQPLTGWSPATLYRSIPDRTDLFVRRRKFYLTVRATMADLGKGSESAEAGKRKLGTGGDECCFCIVAAFKCLRVTIASKHTWRAPFPALLSEHMCCRWLFP